MQQQQPQVYVITSQNYSVGQASPYSYPTTSQQQQYQQQQYQQQQ